MKHLKLISKRGLHTPVLLLAVGIALSIILGPIQVSAFGGTLFFNRTTPEIRKADPNTINQSSIVYKGAITKDVKADPFGVHLIIFSRPYASGNHNLWLTSADEPGSTPFNITGDGSINVDSFDWSPRYFEVVWSDGDDLFTTDLLDGAVTQLTSGSDIDTNPQFRGDGRMMAFDRNMEGNQEVFTYNFINETITNITNNDAFDTLGDSDEPWNGQSVGYGRVLFQSDRNGNFDIFSVYKDGTNIRAIAVTSVDEVDATYSPNSRYIAHRRQHVEGSDYTVVLRTSLGTYVRILGSSGTVARLDWAPQSDGLVLARALSGPSSHKVVVVNLNATEFRTVAAMSAVRGLDWSL